MSFEIEHDEMLDAVRRSIFTALSNIAEQVVEEAKERVESLVRSHISDIAIQIAKTASYERYGQDIRMTVTFPMNQLGDQRKCTDAANHSRSGDTSKES